MRAVDAIIFQTARPRIPVAARLIDTHYAGDMIGAVPEEKEMRESTNVFTPHDDANNPIVFDKSNPLWAKLNNDRFRVTVEICYC
jgi:hypothetical protein